jgi:hypothetical protein
MARSFWRSRDAHHGGWEDEREEEREGEREARDKIQ